MTSANPSNLTTLDYASPEVATAKSARLVSLDIFRGMTIAGMLLVNNPGKGMAYGPLEHVEWNGWTPTDMVFPFFLFMVGVAIPFSMAKRSTVAHESRGNLLGHIWIRALSLFMLGELLTGFPFNGIGTLPAGFGTLSLLRAVTWILCSVGIVGLLYPWKSRKLGAIIPLLITVAFYALALVIQQANQAAIKHGLDPSFSFGNGLLRPDRLRIPGVLQRIGICYGVAASIALFASWRAVLGWIVVFFALYSVLMFKVPYPDHVTGSLSKEDNLARKIDEWLLIRYQTDADGNVIMRNGNPALRWNHAYSYPDNEGAISTLPAIGSVLIGILVGMWLRTQKSPVERCAGLLAMGVFVAIFGTWLDAWLMPINKNIWTPSFTVFMAGMGMLGLGTMFWIADVRLKRGWALLFKIFGMNAIGAFVAAGIVTRVGYMIKVTMMVDERDADGALHAVPKVVNLLTFFQQQADNVLHWVAHTSLGWRIGQHIHFYTQENVSLTYSIFYILVILALMSILYRLKIFLKV